MMLKTDEIAEHLKTKRLRITPTPNLDDIAKDGTASIDLRLGRWFVSIKQNQTAILRIAEPKERGDDEEEEETDPVLRQQKAHYVRFGEDFVLHPGKFILGATMEWVNLPADLAGYVSGKSSWGRRGLVIETAPGVHPGFSGCITLELTNVGEIPIQISPGAKICQLFLHPARGGTALARSSFDCHRKPSMSSIRKDRVLDLLSREP